MSSTTRSGRWSLQPLQRVGAVAEPRGPASRRAGGTRRRPRAPSVRRRRRAPAAGRSGASGRQYGRGRPSRQRPVESFASVSRFVDRRVRDRPTVRSMAVTTPEQRTPDRTAIRRAGAVVVAAGVALAVGELVTRPGRLRPVTRYCRRHRVHRPVCGVAQGHRRRHLRHQRQGGADRWHRRRLAPPRGAARAGRGAPAVGRGSRDRRVRRRSACSPTSATRRARPPPGSPPRRSPSSPASATLLVLLRLAPASRPRAHGRRRGRRRGRAGADGTTRRTFVVTAGVVAAGAIGATVLGRRQVRPTSSTRPGAAPCSRGPASSMPHPVPRALRRSRGCRPTSRRPRTSTASTQRSARRRSTSPPGDWTSPAWSTARSPSATTSCSTWTQLRTS